jgi:hypothetical protein
MVDHRQDEHGVSRWKDQTVEHVEGAMANQLQALAALWF